MKMSATQIVACSGRRACRSGSPPRETACGGSSAAPPDSGCGSGPGQGGRAATPGTTTCPVGLLILTLGDGVRDPADTQRRPVGPAGIGLVAGQMLGAHPGPATATRPRHPHPVYQPDQLGGVGVLPRRESGGQVTATPVADRVELGGQPTPRPPQRLLPACLDRAEPPLRAPAAC
jgi:hypothetical protein